MLLRVVVFNVVQYAVVFFIVFFFLLRNLTKWMQFDKHMFHTGDGKNYTTRYVSILSIKSDSVSLIAALAYLTF